MSLSKNDIARLRGLSRSRRDRREAGRFVVEGRKLTAEVLESPLEVLQVVVDEADPWSPDVVTSFDLVDVAAVARHQLERIASTTSPQPVVAEVALPSSSIDDLVADRPVLVGVALNDPGNVGTLARTAEAAGFAGLVLLGDCADPWSPKAVRASAGALFRLPVHEERDTGSALVRLHEFGFVRFGTRMHDASPCDTTDLTGPVAIVLGSEAHGLDDATVASIDAWLQIPMAGRVESLNVAMAGTILAYEVARQRRGAEIG